jgi:hypothetical protein
MKLDPRMVEPQRERFQRSAGDILTPFVPYCELTNEQQRCVKTRRGPTAEATLKAFAFWIMRNGSVAHYGMCHLPVLPHRDGKHYKPTPRESG